MSTTIGIEQAQSTTAGEDPSWWYGLEHKPFDYEDRTPDQRIMLELLYELRLVRRALERLSPAPQLNSTQVWQEQSDDKFDRKYLLK